MTNKSLMDIGFGLMLAFFGLFAYLLIRSGAALISGIIGWIGKRIW
jgi:hypothetical protein